MPTIKKTDYSKNVQKQISIGGKSWKYWEDKIKNSRIFNKYLVEGKTPKPNTDINESIIIDKYNLAGIEYGNWVNQEKRHTFLVGLDVSLAQLEKATGIKKIGFGTISIAYGARGSGLAAAHFEPSTFALL